MKFVFTCAVLVLALVYCANAQSHSQEWGKNVLGDKKIYGKYFTKESQVLQVQKGTSKYTGLATVTYIKVTDRFTNGKGGYATLVKGGPGNKFSEIELKSQRGEAYNFYVEIWGK